jgi:WD40 repeat protein
MTYADEITYTETEQLSVLKNTYKHPEDLDGLVFSPDGKLLALYGMNTPLVLMDVKTLQIKSTLDFTEKGIQTVVFSPNGKYLAAGFVDSTLMIWDIHPNPSEPKLIRYIPVPDIRAIDAIGFSQDNGELFLASHDKRFGYHGLIHIYDVKDLS